MLNIPANTAHMLTALANSVQEICGFVLKDGTVVAIRNASEQPYDSFFMDQDAQKEFVDRNYEMIAAVFHTHPKGICWPSSRDVVHWPAACSEGGISYLVVTTREICEFRMDENGKPKPVE